MQVLGSAPVFVRGIKHTKSLQEATSKVQAAGNSDLFLNPICTCPSGKAETDSSSGDYPVPAPVVFSVVLNSGLSGRKLRSREGEVLLEEEMKCHSSQRDA